MTANVEPPVNDRGLNETQRLMHIRHALLRRTQRRHRRRVEPLLVHAHRATTLGVLRIATGLLALYAVATYAPDLERWFADDGMLPMSLIRDLYRPEGQILGQRSLLDYLPDSMLWPAYWRSLAVIGLYTLGIGGRVIAIAATIATLSFFTRAPLVIGEFEHVLAMLLIYLCIGRACDAFSILIALRKRKTPPQLHLQPPASSLRPPSTPSPSASSNSTSR